MQIDIRKLSFSYPQSSQLALNEVSLSIPTGCCLGLLGANGAGKTTLMSLMCGLQSTKDGQIFLDGVPLEKLSRAQRQKISLVPQDFAFYPQLSVWDNMIFFASLYNIKDKGYLNSLLEQTGLTEYRYKSAKHLSGGLKRRLNFAIGRINNPQLIFLDEVTVGIDPASRQFILQSVQDLNSQGVTVIYTSHYLQEIEQLCNYLVLLNQGQVICQGTLDNILSTIPEQTSFETNPPLKPEHAKLCHASIKNTIWQSTMPLIKLYPQLTQYGYTLSKLKHNTPTLEQFYLNFLKEHTK